MTKWTREYERKYQREWYQLRKRGKKLKTCKICKRLFSVSVSAKKRKFCESPDCKAEANRLRVAKRLAEKRKEQKGKKAILAPVGDFNQKGIAVHQIQGEVSPDRLISLINGILKNRSKVIGIR